MFHAFRCVFDYVEMCVGRIGFYLWCIYFCTSHVRAYFMHTYSLFSFLFVLLVMCFLSFSPSLSLSDRLHMAPKRKSTMAWNPLGSESSSSNPTPLLHIWFHDVKAQQDFLENFQRCGFHLERHVILSIFSDISLPGVIWTRGWDSLCEILLRCPIVFIQKFYSNIHDINASVCHNIQRYMYCSHSKSYIRDTTCPEGITS